MMLTGRYKVWREYIIICPQCGAELLHDGYPTLLGENLIPGKALTCQRCGQQMRTPKPRGWRSADGHPEYDVLVAGYVERVEALEDEVKGLQADLKRLELAEAVCRAVAEYQAADDEVNVARAFGSAADWLVTMAERRRAMFAALSAWQEAREA